MSRRALQVRKFSWADFLMSAAEYVERAAWWSKELTRFRSRGPGDLENAMRAIEREYGLDYWLLWRLRYRRSQIKDIGISVYARLEAAYRAEVERQYDKLGDAIHNTRELVGDGHPTVVAAAAVVDAHRGTAAADAAQAAREPSDSESVSGRAELAKEDGDGGWKTGDGEREASPGYKT
jgi:hypothetical protein